MGAGRNVLLLPPWGPCLNGGSRLRMQAREPAFGVSSGEWTGAREAWKVFSCTLPLFTDCQYQGPSLCLLELRGDGLRRTEMSLVLRTEELCGPGPSARPQEVEQAWLVGWTLKRVAGF